MTLWLSELPSWASFVLLVVAANCGALALMAAVRGWHRRTGVVAGPPVVAAWATCCGAFAALLFAFSIVTLWNQDVRANTNLDQEISSLRQVARDIAPAQLPMLRRYVRLSLDEWPRLCRDRPDPRVLRALADLERVAHPSVPAYGDNLYRELGVLEDMRSKRWQEAEAAVPDEVWVALIVLSLALLVVLANSMPERTGTHIALMLAVGSALGALFWVTVLLEYPFCGLRGIGPNELAAVARLHGL